MFLGSAPFPPMMLQTLIENSIKHGLEPKIEGGTVTVRAFVEGATLNVEVCDDGVGIDPHADDGIGLANIRERLQLLYGAQAELVIAMPPGGGACTTIRLPYKMMEDV
jgi:LytS/YehU family sensor histidine kinase